MENALLEEASVVTDTIVQIEDDTQEVQGLEDSVEQKVSAIREILIEAKNAAATDAAESAEEYLETI